MVILWSDVMDDGTKQLKKGVLEILILDLLTEKDRYGYELIKELSERSQEYFELKEGTLYPLLYRLNGNGLIENYWGKEMNEAARRKYYHLTEKGIRQLKQKKQQWKELIAAVNLILSDQSKGEYYE